MQAKVGGRLDAAVLIPVVELAAGEYDKTLITHLDGEGQGHITSAREYHRDVG
jgi:hypothetical protein